MNQEGTKLVTIVEKKHKKVANCFALQTRAAKNTSVDSFIYKQNESNRC